MSKESFIKEWLNCKKEMILEFPNGTYYYIHYDEANDRLEYGDMFNVGFKADGGIDCDYEFDLDANLEALLEYVATSMPELNYTNSEGWLDNLTN